MTKKEMLSKQLESLRAKVAEAFQKMLSKMDESTKAEYESLKGLRDDLEADYAKACEEEASAERFEEHSHERADAHNDRQSAGKYSEETIQWLQSLREAVVAGGRFSGTLPNEVSDYIVRKRAELGGIRKYVTVIKATGEYTVLIDGNGVQVKQVDSGASFGESDVTINAVMLGGLTFGGVGKIAKNMVADYAVDLVAYIGDLFAEALNKSEEDLVFNGLGHSGDTKKIRGIVRNSTQNVVTKTGASASLTWQNVVDTIHKLKGSYRTKATMFISQGALDSIFNLTDGVGGHHLFDQSKPITSILGIPVVVTDVLGPFEPDKPQIVVGDFSKYFLCDRQAMDLQVLTETYALKGQVGVLATQRIDGEGVPEAFAVMKTGASA